MHTDFKAISDTDLIKKALQGEESALTALFERHKEGVKIYISKFVPADDIEDICMQAFQKAFEHLNSYDSKLSIFKTWLYTIARNVSIDHAAKQSTERKNLPTTSLDREREKGDAIAAMMLDNGKSVDEIITGEEDLKTLEQAIEGLSPLYRDIARARFLKENEYEEIAISFNLPVNTVKTRIKRAKEMLIKALEED